MKTRAGQKIRLTSVEELLGVANEESAMDLEIAKIRPFKDHPFKVLDDEKMQDLMESIRINGILSPVLVRPIGNDTYEMVSGHRRMHAAMMLGMDTVPAIIREMTDDEAKDNCDQNGHDLSGRRSRDVLADELGESTQQVHRYIRLTELIPELLEYVDQKRIQFTVAVEISYIDQEVQKWLFEYIKDNGAVKLNQITLLRTQLQTGAITQAKMIALLNGSQPGKAPSSKLTFTERKLREYFPATYTTTEMRNIIEDLLREWKEHQEIDTPEGEEV